jgi:hypothetical protein
MFPDPIKVTIPANANHSTKNDAIQIAIATISGTSTLAVSFHHTFIDLVILLKHNAVLMDAKRLYCVASQRPKEAN